MAIKVLGFDQGGIFLRVEYSRILDEFRRLGATNPEAIYTQAEQVDYIDKFEQGKITPDQFRIHLKHDLIGIGPEVSDSELDFAWNAMLLDFNLDCFKVILDFRNQGYITFLYSNINDIHYNRLMAMCREAGIHELYSQCFDEQYFSHKFGYNKPHSLSFKELAADLAKKYQVAPAEILFVDDSAKHIYGRPGHKNEGAISAGLQGLLVPQNLSGAELKDLVEQKIA
jgi:glucose-1-phosphatase